MSHPFKRIIGEYGGETPGPLLFIIAGIHGNEAASVYACEKVFAELEQLQPPCVGKIVAVSGNLQALNKHQRYIERDLNRMWSESEVARVHNIPDESILAPEEIELKALLSLIETEEANMNGGPFILVDLHSTSAPGGLFSIVTNDPYNRALAEALHAPVIFDLMTSLASTTLKYAEAKGFQGIAFEAGQHDDPETTNNHYAAIWLLFAAAGMIARENLPMWEASDRQLRDTSLELPRYVRVTHRHPVVPEDRYQMVPGFINFQTVGRQELLAHDRRGKIRSPFPGLMLMPLYQPQGEDGYFLIEEIAHPPV
ncbi:MAG: succinylglutamate desuccinylase/aspartoacylase family protein [Bacteroidota bacterium]